MLKLRLGSAADLAWAQETVVERHYLKQRVDPRARPWAYVLEHDGRRAGLVMVGIPHATKNRGWWGYPGLPTQWQVVDLNRIWIDPAYQAGGHYCQPGIVPGFTDRRGKFRSTLISELVIPAVLARIQQDWVSLWPPVYPDQPYHVELVVSYHDPAVHKGTIYRAAGAEPMYTKDGKPAPGSSGKFGWCWRLPAPAWTWNEIEILRPRTMRLPLEV